MVEYADTEFISLSKYIKNTSTGREMQEGGEMGTYCICITDSLCYKAETDTPL